MDKADIDVKERLLPNIDFGDNTLEGEIHRKTGSYKRKLRWWMWINVFFSTLILLSFLYHALPERLGKNELLKAATFYCKY